MGFPRSLLIVAMAIATLVAAPLVRTAAAGIAWGVIECCCGEHAGDHRCGCPDCPAGDHDGGDHDSEMPGLGPCGANAQWLSPTALAPFVAPARVAPARPALPVTTGFVAPRPMRGRVVHPIVPPS